jgi:hypothetical protein
MERCGSSAKAGLALSATPLPSILGSSVIGRLSSPTTSTRLAPHLTWRKVRAHFLGRL